jgi:putative membrane protein
LSEDEWRPRGHVWVGLLVVVAVLIVVPIVVSAIFYVLRPMGRAYFPFMGYYPIFFFPFGWVFGFLILFFLLRWIFWPWGWGSHRRYRGYLDEYQILRVRYARGEITKEQFNQMTRDLQESSQKTQKPT